ncbi:MAG: hypothetical protein WCK88_08315 [bacterium]
MQTPRAEILAGRPKDVIVAQRVAPVLVISVEVEVLRAGTHFNHWNV